MKPRIFFSTAFLVFLAASPRGNAATFQASTGLLSFDPGGVHFDFESDDDLARFTTIKFTDLYTVKAGPGDAARAVDEGLVGASAVRVGAKAGGLYFNDSSVFQSFAKKRIEVRFWAKSEGREPIGALVYGKAGAALPYSEPPVATVGSVPTGRETSDGWAEYVIGPVDGNVLGRTASGLILAPEVAALSNYASTVKERGTFLLDAVEILPIDDSIQPTTACTEANAASVCGAYGDCFAGACVPSAALWGSMLNQQHRKEVVDRGAFLASSVQGEISMLGRMADYAAATNDLVGATPPRTFQGSLEAAISGLRNVHTSPGGSMFYTSLTPRAAYGTAGAIGGCFGLVTNDLPGGGNALGFAVFATEPTALVKRGDLLKSVDGEPAVAWARRMNAKYATSRSPSQASEDTYTALALSDFLGAHAATVVVERCSDATCTSRTDVLIPLGDSVRKAALNGGVNGYAYTIACDGRLSRVGTQVEGVSDDAFRVGPVENGVSRVEFDGFTNPIFAADAEVAFPTSSGKFLIDARLGRGGKTVNMEAFIELLAPKTTPAVLVPVFRTPIGAAELACAAQDDYSCIFPGGSVTQSQGTGKAERYSARVALLNGASVSANDYVAKVLKARPNTRLFSAGPTAGAFGAVTGFGSLIPGLTLGSFQFEDTRFGASLAEAMQGPLISGTGVEPDEIVFQKMTDLLQNKDTAVLAAQTWLAGGK